MTNPTTLAIDETGKTKGTWTSEVLHNDKANFPEDTSSEWGYLTWEQDEIDEVSGNTMRIDILKASDDSVLIENIIKQEDGTPTILFGTAADLEDIKIRVKLYYNTGDPPIAKPRVWNIRLNYYNWTLHQVVTNFGKSVLLNRSFRFPSNIEKYLFHFFGGRQNTLNKITSEIENPIYLHFTNLPEGDYLGSNTARPGTMVLGETGSEGEGDLQLGPLAYSRIEFDPIQRSMTLISVVRDLPQTANLGIVGVGNFGDLLFCGGMRTNFELQNDKLYEIKTTFRIITTQTLNRVMTYEGSNTLLNKSVYDEYETDYSVIRNFEAGSDQSNLDPNMTDLQDGSPFGPVNVDTVSISPDGTSASPYYIMRFNEGNDKTYNAFAWLGKSDDSTNFDPDSFTDYNNAFDKNESTFAYKSTSGNIFIGKTFLSPRYLKFVRVKGKGKAFSNTGDSYCKISLYLFDGVDWQIIRQVAGLRMKTGNEIEFNTDSVETIKSFTRGVAVAFETSSSANREQRLNIVDYDVFNRRMGFAYILPEPKIKTPSIMYQFQTTIRMSDPESYVI
jgi:hypothetical protein